MLKPVTAKVRTIIITIILITVVIIIIVIIIIPLFILGSIYDTNAIGTEQMPETNNSK